jgi:hypothetical protein
MSITRSQALEMEKRTWQYLDNLTEKDCEGIERSYAELDAIELCKLYRSNLSFLRDMGDRWARYE